ncbi:MAG: hypothetical protein CMJ77_05425 [Planctomycetaceae bacterium]|nr:hypothetical protein [Planctomycetaceae bacterium]
MQSMSRHLCWLILLASVVFLTQLGEAKLWDRDEPRNARCAWEMLDRQDWVVPTFNDELRTHKPILLYWLTMSSYIVFGVNEFGARFASAFLAIGTVLLTYFIGCRLLNPRVGLWSSVVLTGTLMFNVAARAATPDSTLIFCMTLAFAIYVWSVPREIWSDPNQGEHSNLVFRSWPWAALIYGAMGLAVLAKGPVGIVLPTAVIGMFLLIARSAPLPPNSTWPQRTLHCLKWSAPVHFLQTCWTMRPLTAITTASVVAVPWYLTVGFQTNGEWLRGFFLEHNVSRAIASMEGHQGSILFYPVALLIGFFPWSVLAVPVGLWSFSELQLANKYRPYTFLACWIAVFMTAFSLAATKLPSYITPTYPAVALLCGGFIVAFLDQISDAKVASWWPRISAICLTVIGLGLLIGLPIAASQLLPGDEWLGLVGSIPFAGGFITIICLLKNQRKLSMLSLSCSSLTFVLILFSIVGPRVSDHQQIDELLAFADSDSEIVAAYASHEPSWVFYAGHHIPFYRVDETVEARDFFCEHPNHLLITTQTGYDLLRPHLPPTHQVIEQVPYFLRGQELVLLGHVATTASKSPRQHEIHSPAVNDRAPQPSPPSDQL